MSSIANGVGMMIGGRVNEDHESIHAQRFTRHKHNTQRPDDRSKVLSSTIYEYLPRCCIDGDCHNFLALTVIIHSMLPRSEGRETTAHI